MHGVVVAIEDDGEYRRFNSRGGDDLGVRSCLHRPILPGPAHSVRGTARLPVPDHRDNVPVSASGHRNYARERGPLLFPSDRRGLPGPRSTQCLGACSRASPASGTAPSWRGERIHEALHRLRPRHNPTRLSPGQVPWIPAQHPPELLLGEPAAEPRARVLLGACDEGDPESAVERTAPPGAASRLAPAHSANRPSNGPGPLGMRQHESSVNPSRDALGSRGTAGCPDCRSVAAANVPADPVAQGQGSRASRRRRTRTLPAH